jgi:low affinity Fe/Cu permease
MQIDQKNKKFKKSAIKIFIDRMHRSFDKLTNNALAIFGHPVTFIAALLTIVLWLCNKDFFNQGIKDMVRDLILALTFISFFLIQKAFNHLATVVHLKLNELLATHENASNLIVNIEEKTEEELKELSKQYVKLSEEAYAADKVQKLSVRGMSRKK